MGAHQAILERLRKLHALAQSSNPHEAAAAAAKAEELVQKYNIAEAELDVQEAPEEAPVNEELYAENGYALSTWKSQLAIGLQKAHSCQSYQSTRRTETGKPVKTMRLAGRPSDIATIRYLFAWLCVEIERLTSSSGLKGRSALAAFRFGCVEGIRNAMFTVRREERAKASGAALVRIDARAEAAKDVLPGNLKTTRGRISIGSRSAREAGQRAGASIHGGKSFTGGTTRLLGSGK